MSDANAFFDLAEIIIRYCPDESRAIVDKFEKMLETETLANPKDDAANTFIGLWDSYREAQAAKTHRSLYPGWF